MVELPTLVYLSENTLLGDSKSHQLDNAERTSQTGLEGPTPQVASEIKADDFL